MTPPKKKTLTLWDGHTEDSLIKAVYHSDEAIKEWIEEQAKKHNKDLHKLSLLIELLKFIEE